MKRCQWFCSFFYTQKEEGCSLKNLLKYHILILLAAKLICIFVFKTWKLINISVTMWELRNKNWNISDLQLSVLQQYRQHTHPSWYSTAEQAKGQLQRTATESKKNNFYKTQNFSKRNHYQFTWLTLPNNGYRSCCPIILIIYLLAAFLHL